jgi:hypothetical protein
MEAGVKENFPIGGMDAEALRRRYTRGRPLNKNPMIQNIYLILKIWNGQLSMTWIHFY